MLEILNILDYIAERGHIIQDDYSLILDNSIIVWYPLLLFNREKCSSSDYVSDTSTWQAEAIV